MCIRDRLLPAGRRLAGRLRASAAHRVHTATAASQPCRVLVRRGAGTCRTHADSTLQWRAQQRVLGQLR
eukprot:4428718-Alexandrium_andersonii.AAC.1